MKRLFASFVLTALLIGSQSGCSSLSVGKKIREPINATYAVDSDAFRDSIGNLLGAPLVEGNKIEELKNGDEIFASMLEAIRSAKKTITFETFIWSSGEVGTKFVEAMADRARAGVKVHVIVDALGSSKLSRKDVRTMEKAGVMVEKYNRPVSFKFWRSDHRTHRKIMVVDGKVGFTGGVCISDDWAGNAEPPHWRDTHFRVEGPVVGQIQGSFVDNWVQMRSEVLHGPDYFPKIEPAGSMLAQAFKSGPREGSESARLAYMLSFAAARKSIRISHAYFAPDDLVLKALMEARKRGVKIEILFPRKIDNIAVRKASWSLWKGLLEAGVEFYEYQPTLYHCKIVIIDDVWSIVGSVNFDDRSLRINDEANLNVLDKGFAAMLIKSFEEDKKKSKPLKKEDFKKRNILSRCSDWFLGCFRSQL